MVFGHALAGVRVQRVVVAAVAANKKGARLRRRLWRRVVFASLRGRRPFGPRVVVAFGHALAGVRVQRVHKVQRVQRVMVAPSAQFYRPPFGGHPLSRFAGLLLKGSMSLDFRVASLPYSTAITDSLDSQVAPAPLRIQFAGVTPVPLPPYSGGRIKSPYAFLQRHMTQLFNIPSPTAKWGAKRWDYNPQDFTAH